MVLTILEICDPNPVTEFEDIIFGSKSSEKAEKDDFNKSKISEGLDALEICGSDLVAEFEDINFRSKASEKAENNDFNNFKTTERLDALEIGGSKRNLKILILDQNLVKMMRKMISHILKPQRV